MKEEKQIIISRITKCVDNFKRISGVFETLESVFGYVTDSKAGDAVFIMFDDYVSEVRELIGDDNEWLNWFIFENKCGEAELQAKAESWTKSRKIKTINNLADLILGERRD